MLKRLLLLLRGSASSNISRHDVYVESKGFSLSKCGLFTIKGAYHDVSKGHGGYSVLCGPRFFFGKVLCNRLPVFLLVFILIGISEAQESKKRIIFEEQKIEGKLRRPQLVLIKAEQRPAFPPMVMQSLEGNDQIVEYVAREAIESSPYTKPFEISGEKITNYKE